MAAATYCKKKEFGCDDESMIDMLSHWAEDGSIGNAGVEKLNQIGLLSLMTTIIPAFKRLRQEDCYEFKDSLG